MPQKSVPCVVYRGGTSRGLFFHKQDLPNDIKQRNEIFLQGIDAWNLAQVDGLGGGTSSTSKVCVIAPPSRPDAHADWTFYQLGVADTIIDEKEVFITSFTKSSKLGSSGEAMFRNFY